LSIASILPSLLLSSRRHSCSSYRTAAAPDTPIANCRKLATFSTSPLYVPFLSLNSGLETLSLSRRKVHQIDYEGISIDRHGSSSKWRESWHWHCLDFFVHKRRGGSGRATCIAKAVNIVEE